MYATVFAFLSLPCYAEEVVLVHSANSPLQPDDGLSLACRFYGLEIKCVSVAPVDRRQALTDALRRLRPRAIVEGLGLRS